MPREVRIEHHYPQAHLFLVEHGQQGLVVLHALLEDSQLEGSKLIAKGSSRTLAARTELMSKDTCHRHVLKLQRAGVLERIDTVDSRSPAYIVHLDDLGITVAFPDHS